LLPQSSSLPSWVVDGFVEVFENEGDTSSPRSAIRLLETFIKQIS